MVFDFENNGKWEPEPEPLKLTKEELEMLRAEVMAEIEEKYGGAEKDNPE